MTNPEKTGFERDASGEGRFGDAMLARIEPARRRQLADETLARWQVIVNLMARIAGVPATLIMRVDSPQIEVFVASSTKGNPYEKGERADLNTGLYCEKVMVQRSALLVPDALADRGVDLFYEADAGRRWEGHVIWKE